MSSPGSCLAALPTAPTKDQRELLGSQAPGYRGPQIKRVKPSWLEASILRAQELLPKGLRCPKLDGLSVTQHRGSCSKSLAPTLNF